MRYEITNILLPTETLFYSSLRLLSDSSMFIAEGTKVVERLLASDITITSLLMTDEHYRRLKHQIELHDQQTDARLIIQPKETIQSIVGYRLHQGLIAAAKIPPQPTLEEIIAVSSIPRRFVILDSIADPENVGAICRTAYSLGVSAVIYDGKCVSPWIRRAVRVSMGAVFHLPLIRHDCLDAVRLLRAKHICVYAAALHSNALPLSGIDHTNDTAVIFGSEGYGIRSELIAECNASVIIPMKHSADSLNVAAAQAIILYEMTKTHRQS